MLKNLVFIQLQSLFSQMFKKTRKGRTTNATSAGKIVGYILLLAFVFLYAGVFLGILFGTVSVATPDPSVSWAAPALASLLCFLLCFVGTVFSTQSMIYNSKDNDLLISMPIPPKTILLSRIFTLAVLNWFFALLIFLPLEISWTLTRGAGLPSLAILALFVLIPMLSMTVTLFIGWLIALITSKLKNKNIVTVILSVIAMGLYLVLCFNLGDITETVGENPSVVIDFLSSKLGLFVIFGKTVSSFDIVSVLITLAVCILPFAAAVALLSRSFYRIATAKRTAKKAVYVKKEMKTSSVRAALLKKETGRLFSSATYVMNSFMGGIFAIICAVMVVLNSDVIAELASDLVSSGLLKGSEGAVCAIAVMVVTVFINSMNVPSAASVSLEGKTLWILKSMPVTAKEVLTAKMFAAALTTAVPSVILVTACVIFLPTTPLYAILAYIVALTVAFFSSGVGIIVNMLMPRFDWVSETVCVKQSGSVAVSMLSMMFLSLIVGGLSLVAAFFIGAETAVVILTVLTVVAAAASYLIVTNCFNNRFKNLG